LNYMNFAGIGWHKQSILTKDVLCLVSYISAGACLAPTLILYTSADVLSTGYKSICKYAHFNV